MEQCHTALLDPRVELSLKERNGTTSGAVIPHTDLRWAPLSVIRLVVCCCFSAPDARTRDRVIT